MVNGSEVEAYFDWDEHPVMQQVRRERLDAWTKLVDRGVPGKIGGDYLDLDLPRYDGDDIGHLPATLLPMDKSGELPTPEKDSVFAEEETPAAKAITVIRSKLLTRKPVLQIASPSIVECSCGCSLEDALMEIKGRSEKEIKLWKGIVAPRRETIRAYTSKFNRVLMIARGEVLRKIERAAASEKSIVTKHVAADFMFNLENFTNVFQAAMRSVGLDALKKAGDQVFAELGKDDPWKMPQAETLTFLTNRKNKLSGVPDEVFDRIRNVITDGLQSGDPLNDIAAAIRGEFNDIGAGRARVIASTETSAAYGYGRHEAMSAAGVQFKRWLTSGNSNVREAHELMNGAIVPIDDPFVVINPKDGDTDEIDYPGDINGEPWDVINCHCVQVASATGPDDDDDGGEA
jgi:SPP1 gp7 family putative phage head morphogenesis protein